MMHDGGGSSRLRHTGKETAGVAVSQPRVNRLALQGEDAEDTLMDSPQRFPSDESLQALNSEGELAKGKRPFVAQTAMPQAREIFIGGVVRAIDDPQILRPAALHGGLGESLLSSKDEVQRAANQVNGDAGTAFGYDQVGNRTDNGYSHTAVNRMKAGANFTDAYDAEVNQTQKSKSGEA